MAAKLLLLLTVLIYAATSTTFVCAQTLAELVQNNPALSQVAAFVSQNPAWGTPGNKTLFVPRNQAGAGGPLPGGSRAGTILVADRAIDFRNDPAYQILTDAGGVARVVYDNYNRALSTPTEVHMRYGPGEVLVTETARASNGVLYIMAGPIPDPQPCSAVLANIFGAAGEHSQLLSLLGSAGLAQAIDSLQNVTIFAPTNAALANASSTLASLSPGQVAAVLQHHLVGSIVYSTALSNRPLTTLLGQTAQLSVQPGANGEPASTVGGAPLAIPADSMCAGGVIQRINGVIVPSPIPSGPAPLAGLNATATATATAAATAIATATAPVTSTAATPTNGARATPTPTNAATSVNFNSLIYFTALFAAIFML
ncbi:Stabilin-2 [Quaeritorhiza haematococci]|nr:Stabilin-2 [Quaeritorhiza haematococci]